MKKRMRLLFAVILVLVSLQFSRALPRQGVSKLTADEIGKVHSHLFRKGPAGQIPDMLSRTKGDIYVPCVVGVMQRVQLPLIDELATLASKSDLIVVAKAEESTTHMNANRDFLYSDWNFEVEEVLKNNRSAVVATGATVVVTRPGGKLQVDERMVHATCADFQDFGVGQEYLLYLHFIPETGAYTSSGSAAFALSSIKRLDSVNYHQPEASDKEALLNSAREGVTISTGTSSGSGGPK